MKLDSNLACSKLPPLSPPPLQHGGGGEGRNKAHPQSVVTQNTGSAVPLERPSPQALPPGGCGGCGWARDEHHAPTNAPGHTARLKTVAPNTLQSSGETSPTAGGGRGVEMPLLGAGLPVTAASSQDAFRAEPASRIHPLHRHSLPPPPQLGSGSRA